MEPSSDVSINHGLLRTPRLAGPGATLTNLDQYRHQCDHDRRNFVRGLQARPGSEYSSVIGDEDAALLHQGHTNKTLSVVLEDGIPQGTYDIRIEVWPRAHIGGPGYGTWHEPLCGNMSV